jgi:hypothetical protein
MPIHPLHHPLRCSTSPVSPHRRRWVLLPWWRGLRGWAGPWPSSVWPSEDEDCRVRTRVVGQGWGQLGVATGGRGSSSCVARTPRSGPPPMAVGRRTSSAWLPEEDTSLVAPWPPSAWSSFVIGVTTSTWPPSDRGGGMMGHPFGSPLLEIAIFWSPIFKWWSTQFSFLVSNLGHLRYRYPYIAISQWSYYPWPIYYTHSHLPSEESRSTFPSWHYPWPIYYTHSYLPLEESRSTFPSSPENHRALHISSFNSMLTPRWFHIHNQPLPPPVLRPKLGNYLTRYSKCDFL